MPKLSAPSLRNSTPELGLFGDVFALQDKVTRQIVTALAVSLTADEQVERVQTETEPTEVCEMD